MNDELTNVRARLAEIVRAIADIDDRYARNVTTNIGPTTDIGKFDSDTITPELGERRKQLEDEAARLQRREQVLLQGE